MQKQMETMAAKLKAAEANAAAAEASAQGSGDADALSKQVGQLKAENAALQKKVNEAPKSAACVLM